jgi:hypothetical protein
LAEAAFFWAGTDGDFVAGAAFVADARAAMACPLSCGRGPGPRSSRPAERGRGGKVT